MDREFARHHQGWLLEHKQRKVEVIDEQPIVSGDIPHLAKVEIGIQDDKKQSPMLVTKLGHYPIVVRIQSLRLLNVAVKFRSFTVRFSS
jgi:hypothetical protein